MTKRSRKLLKRMRASQSGWRMSELHALYEGFGFEIDTSKGGHDKVRHPKIPGIVEMLPRKNKVLVAYVKNGVKNIDSLKALLISLGENISEFEDNQQDGDDQPEGETASQ